ncbi:redoxin domain-containing protein (plasmid) [Leisingera aquaemixtae]|uniref:redoxin domain-containing protein n=1 Tax=Leisingera aquaemixtae TaxID=1396826 RepID=UPI0021A74AC0|nr:redoxin domain-containing protein [Leisingera aquaemixtae]UWQ39379.1 redoxin domain-containing protein [Leisingera aquaemixtae]
MPAPELDTVQWFNSPGPVTLQSLRGRVVMIEAFQMLCPGCVRHGLPLAQKVRAAFPQDRVAVLGLHTVFEHHAAMTPVSLAAFLQEYRITFPVGVDRPGGGPMPRTMEAYGMRGTPSLLLIGRDGELRAHHFGEVSELRLGAEIAALMAEDAPAAAGAAPDGAGPAGGCGPAGCTV